MLIVRAFGHTIEVSRLPPSHKYSAEDDSRILSSLLEGHFPLDCDDRIGAIVSIMKSELILSDYPAKFSFQFWTRHEFFRLLRVLGEFGCQITGAARQDLHARTGILTKSTVGVQLWAAELVTQILAQKDTLDPIHLHAGTPKEFVNCGIPESVVLTREDYMTVFGTWRRAPSSGSRPSRPLLEGVQCPVTQA
jgi:hypothetical protein